MLFLLHDNTRRTVTEHRVAVSRICLKSRNSLGRLHHEVKMKRNNLGKQYDKLAHKQLLLIM